MIDVIIAAVLALFVVLGWKRGLVRTLAELLAVVLALVFSAQAARAAAPVVVDRVLRPATHAAIEQRVNELLRDSTPSVSPLEELEQVVEAIPNDFVREQARGVLEGLGASAEAAAGPAREQMEQAGKDVADAVLDGVVRSLIQSVLCGVFFVILAALFRLAARVLRLAEKLPGVRQLNELGGALLGLGKGLILVCLILWVLKQTGAVTAEMIEKSLAVGLLSQCTGGLLR